MARILLAKPIAAGAFDLAARRKDIRIVENSGNYIAANLHQALPSARTNLASLVRSRCLPGLDSSVYSTSKRRRRGALICTQRNNMPKASKKDARAPLQEVAPVAREVNTEVSEPASTSKPQFAPLSAYEQNGKKVEFRRARFFCIWGHVASAA